jgi:hypothetical protein
MWRKYHAKLGNTPAHPCCPKLGFQTDYYSHAGATLALGMGVVNLGVADERE